jgi:hypothetical protein
VPGSNLGETPTILKTKQNILIIGDNHTQSIASEIQHILDDYFEIQGIVKPTSDLAAITHTVNIQDGPKVGVQYIVLLYTYFWPIL